MYRRLRRGERVLKRSGTKSGRIGHGGRFRGGGAEIAVRRLQGRGLRGPKGGSCGVCGGRVLGGLGSLDSGERIVGSGEKVGEGVGFSCVRVVDAACNIG